MTVELELEDVQAGRLLLSVRCQRRGHPLAEVRAMPEGRVVVAHYSSGRWTRKVDYEPEPVRTIRYHRDTLWLLDAADAVGAEALAVRCACSKEGLLLDADALRDEIAAGKSKLLL